MSKERVIIQGDRIWSHYMNAPMEHKCLDCGHAKYEASLHSKVNGKSLHTLIENRKVVAFGPCTFPGCKCKGYKTGFEKLSQETIRMTLERTPHKPVGDGAEFCILLSRDSQSCPRCGDTISNEWHWALSQYFIAPRWHSIVDCFKFVCSRLAKIEKEVEEFQDWRRG